MPPIHVRVETPSPCLLAESMSLEINQDITKHLHSMKCSSNNEVAKSLSSSSSAAAAALSMKCSDGKGLASNLQGKYLYITPFSH